MWLRGIDRSLPRARDRSWRIHSVPEEPYLNITCMCTIDHTVIGPHALAGRNLRLFPKQHGRSVHSRFLVAGDEHRGNSGHLAAVRLEQDVYRDILFLNMTESRFVCALKYILFFRHCKEALPSARFYVLADDDEFIQLSNLESDLRTLRPDRNVLWGLVMWEALFQAKSLVTHLGWGGWHYTDKGAVAIRHKVARCRRSLRATGSTMASR